MQKDSYQKQIQLIRHPPFEEKQYIIRETPNSAEHANLKTLIEINWHTKYKGWFNSTIANLEDIALKDHYAALNIGRTQYSVCLFIYDLIRSDGMINLLNGFSPLAVGIAAKTADNALILTRRSRDVPVAPAEYQVTAGYLATMNAWEEKIEDEIVKKPILLGDIWGHAVYEIHEELGVPKEEIDRTKLKAIGFAHGTYVSFNPLLTFSYESRLSNEQHLEFKKNTKAFAKGKFELDQFFFVPEDKIMNFLKGEFKEDCFKTRFEANPDASSLGVVDDSLGSLLLYLNAAKGPDAFWEGCEILKSRGLVLNQIVPKEGKYRFEF